MLRDGLNIFNDYFNNEVAISGKKTALQNADEAVDKIEKGFGEEVTIHQIMDHKNALTQLDEVKAQMNQLETRKQKLTLEIKEFFTQFPQTKRISFKPKESSATTQLTPVKEWYVLDLHNEQVRIQNVKA
jgi:hypothetical protein